MAGLPPCFVSAPTASPALRIIGQFLLLGHDAGGIDRHEEEVRLRWILCATGAVQQKLVHEDLGKHGLVKDGERNWGDWI